MGARYRVQCNHRKKSNLIIDLIPLIFQKKGNLFYYIMTNEDEFNFNLCIKKTRVNKKINQTHQP